MVSTIFHQIMTSENFEPHIYIYSTTYFCDLLFIYGGMILSMCLFLELALTRYLFISCTYTHWVIYFIVCLMPYETPFMLLMCLILLLVLIILRKSDFSPYKKS